MGSGPSAHRGCRPGHLTQFFPWWPLSRLLYGAISGGEDAERMLLCSYQVSSHEDFRVLGIPSFPPPPWMITPRFPCSLGGAELPLSPPVPWVGLTLSSVALCPGWG